MAIISPEEIKKKFGKTVSNSSNALLNFLNTSKTNIQNKVDYFNPTSNAGNNFWSSPTANTMVDLQQKIQGPQKQGLIPTFPPIPQGNEFKSPFLNKFADTTMQTARFGANIVPNLANIVSKYAIYNPETKKILPRSMPQLIPKVPKEVKTLKQMNEFLATPEGKKYKQDTQNVINSYAIVATSGLKSGGPMNPNIATNFERMFGKGQGNLPAVQGSNLQNIRIAPPIKPAGNISIAPNVKPSISTPEVKGGVIDVNYKGKSWKVTGDAGVSGDKYRLLSLDGDQAVALKTEVTPIQTTTIKNNVPEYGMSHRPSETGAIASDISQNGEVIPKDFYQHPEWYADMSQPTYKQSFDVLNKIRGNPDAEVTIYRASTKNKINSGDWVTLSKDYAKGEARADTKVYSYKVKAKDIQFAGDDINEFGYYPQSQISPEVKPTSQTSEGLQQVQQPQNLQSPQQFQPLPASPQTGGQLSSGPINQSQGIIPPSTPKPLSDTELIEKLSATLKKAKPIRGQQEKFYSQERARKMARMMSARGKLAGEKGFFSELGALKGEMGKVDFESIRKELTQGNIDRLFNMLKSTDKIDEWEKITAQTGLMKILGEKGGGVPTKGEISKLYEVFGKDFTKALLDKRTTIEKLAELGMQLYNLPRSLMAGAGDLSATLMQNIFFAYRHPVMTAINFKKELKMFASEKYFQERMNLIRKDPNYPLMKEYGLSMTNTGPIITQREEEFMASIAEKIPGIGPIIRASGRAYTGFLNEMRKDAFNQLVKTTKVVNGEVTPKFGKTAANFINNATGRGDLGKLEKIAPILAQGFFSARKLVAAFQLMNPVNYIKADPVVRKEMLKTVMAFLGGNALILALARLAGAEVGDEPTSADYGKIKFGNTRFSTFGSYQQISVLLSRLWKGYGTSSTTGRKFHLGDEFAYKPITRLDLIGRFFGNKEHPTLSLIMSALKGQDNIGRPFDAPSQILNRFIPMVLADGYDLYKEHGPVGLLGVIPAILGIPAQTYGSQVPVMGTTSSGRGTIKLEPVGGISEDIVNKIRGRGPSNIPEEQWENIVGAKEAQTSARIKKEEIKREVNEERRRILKMLGIDY